MKVSIVGPGAVGVTLAHTLLLSGIAREILLVGRNREKAEAEALDLMHAQSFLPISTRVTTGDLSDVEGSEVVVMCASVPTPPQMQSRRVLATGNARLMAQLLPTIAQRAPQAKILFVTNPVDSLTWLARELTGFPPSQLMGMGTLVDSFRLRQSLSGVIGIHPSDLRIYVLGEHGESQFVALSIASSGGEPIEDSAERRQLFDYAKRVGLEILQKKGNTCYAIAQAANYVVKSILLDEHTTIPLSTFVNGFLGAGDLCLSLPVVVGKNGVERVLYPQLNEEEQTAFRVSSQEVGQLNEEIKRELDHSLAGRIDHAGSF